MYPRYPAKKYCSTTQENADAVQKIIRRRLTPNEHYQVKRMVESLRKHIMEKEIEQWKTQQQSNTSN
jgi:hypothetical protein